VVAGHAGEHVGARDITTLFEERVTKGKANCLAGSVVSTIRGGREGKGGERGKGEMLGVEVREELRGYLSTQIVNVICRARRIERCPVHQFQRPGSHSQEDIVTLQLATPSNSRTKSDMSERAPDIRIHLDHAHVMNVTVPRGLLTGPGIIGQEAFRGGAPVTPIGSGLDSG